MHMRLGWVRWGTCALVLSIALFARADRARRSLADCASFEQVDEAEVAVTFTIHNTCAISIDCAVTWRVVCAPEVKQRHAAHPGAASLAITDGASETAEASAAVCGNDAWSIDSVRWFCRPGKT